MFCNLFSVSLLWLYLVITFCLCDADKIDYSSKWEIRTGGENIWELAFNSSVNAVVVKTLRPDFRVICRLQADREPWELKGESFGFVAAWFQLQPSPWKCCMVPIPQGNESKPIDNNLCLYVTKRGVTPPINDSVLAIPEEQKEHHLDAESTIFVAWVTVAIYSACLIVIGGAAFLLRRYFRAKKNVDSNPYDVQLPGADAPRPPDITPEDDYGYMISSPVRSRESNGYIDILKPCYTNDDGYGELLPIAEDQSPSADRGVAIYENVATLMQR